MTQGEHIDEKEEICTTFDCVGAYDYNGNVYRD